MSPPTAPERPPALMVDVHHIAALLGCSPNHVYRLSSTGRLPRPARLGALVRWNLADIERWIADGCPDVEGRADG